MFRIFLITLLCLSNNTIFSQKTVKIDEFISNSEKSIEDLKMAKFASLNKNEDRLFRKGFLPNVALNFTFPAYNRSISEVAQPDGTFEFRESNSANSRVILSLSQKIPLTGGKITISNSLNRLDLFGSQRSTSYSASWFGINFSQSLTFFNDMKWEEKIQEARYNYNNVIYLQKRIEIKKTAINYYFELIKFKNQTALLNAEWNSASKYKKVISNLISAGKRLPYDSIDVELKILDLNRSQVFLKKGELLKIKSINSFFNSDFLNDSDNLLLPGLAFDLQNADVYIERYLEVHEILRLNNLTGLQKELKQLESSKYYSANLALGVGFNNTADHYQYIYQNPNQSQNFTISLSVPLLDFGKRKTEYEISKAKYEIESINLDQDKRDSIEKINLLSQEIADYYDALKIEKSRADLLQKKLRIMEALLFSQKILYSEYSDIERSVYETNMDIMNITEGIYNKITELEKITLLEIIKNDN
ncbi:TolC family protein [Flavobacterium sp. TAB 87]|uniref:TolC family protein n=1 Tax=Flavobacterium sp. TAB 87 TaxID=1729581 RepID=UPI00076C011C|nr:TolC family protein [Flavobacterium sp. TAB 87]KVV16345.1 Outer membrane efflux protein [Flavobacterium sp. TAB 87]